ncbi:hypothetical protein MUK42_33927 [Musa troglodytarum]|uniref:Uncharacterized protein n=1 Tax=Musa troglodytarum TaxID=320322 RepID=A0A9E7KQ28_9LILI|nr:hypothetical protein MUK42_33927 [Musa troglodytarum]URE23708.1 hypothetical protein MUK42_33927 [Musa troglodytarum]
MNRTVPVVESLGLIRRSPASAWSKYLRKVSAGGEPKKTRSHERRRRIDRWLNPPPPPRVPFERRSGRPPRPPSGCWIFVN